MTTRSGWCSPTFGARERTQDHQECAKRMAAGLLLECACERHQNETEEAE